MSGARDYLEEHNVEAILANALQSVVRERPSDPVSAVGKKLLQEHSTKPTSKLLSAPRRHGKTLILFDVDGTLAVPAQKAGDEMIALLARLREDYVTGIVGAAHFEKQELQLGGEMLKKFDFVFSENGVHAFREEKEIHSKSMSEQLGPELWASFESGLDEILVQNRDEAKQLLEAAAPEAAASFESRGTFLEKRRCTVNVCPIGRTPSMTKAERAAYDEVDRRAGYRTRIVQALHERFGPTTAYKLVATIGGQIGLDVAPQVTRLVATAYTRACGWWVYRP
jgi:phosphomannomutase